MKIRICRIDYEFEYKGKVYEGYGVNTGDYDVDNPPSQSHLMPFALFHALGNAYDTEGIEALRGDDECILSIDEAKKFGFDFRYCELHK